MTSHDSGPGAPDGRTRETAPGGSRETALPRPAARVVLLDADDRVLLIRAEWDRQSRWFTPGGRIEPGESPEEAARRELLEETGVDGRMLRWEGLCWLRDWTWHWVAGDTWYASHEHFYVARLPVRGGDLTHPERLDHHALEEVLSIHEARWWSLEELRASGEPTSPVALPELLTALIEHGCPTEPVAIGQ